MNVVLCRKNKVVFFILLSVPFLNSLELRSTRSSGDFLGYSIAKLGKITCCGVSVGCRLAVKSGLKITKAIFHYPKIMAGAVAISALYGASKSVVSRARLYENMDSIGICKMPTFWKWFLWILPKKRSKNIPNWDKVKISDWRLRELEFAVNKKAYPTARTILSTEEIDRNYQFSNSDINRRMEMHNMELYQKSIMKELYNDVGFIDIQSKASAYCPKARLLETIEAGLTELRLKLIELSSYVCFPSRDYDIIGIEKIINDACKKYVLQMPNCPDRNIDIENKALDLRKAFNTNQLLYDKELALDELVKDSIKTEWMHWVTLRPNFGLAAMIYWEVLKRIKRLEALQGIANKY